MLRSLNGIAAIYKPKGFGSRFLIDKLKFGLTKELNQQFIDSEPNVDVSTVIGSPTEACLPDSVSNRHRTLILGPKYKQSKMFIRFMKHLDAASSGVVVIGINAARSQIRLLEGSYMENVYVVRGRLGVATNDHTDEGKVLEKSTYGHITADLLERMFSRLEGQHRNVLVKSSASGLATDSQEMYERAAAGMLRPVLSRQQGEPVQSLILRIKLNDFKPPDFEIEVKITNESQYFLRDMIHNVGLSLRSHAVCTQVRRLRCGPLAVKDALPYTQWSVAAIADNISHCKPILDNYVVDIVKGVEFELSLADRFTEYETSGPNYADLQTRENDE